MPCYLFTFHAYLSWLPDRRRGYVRRNEGILPQDNALAKSYRTQAKEPPIIFDGAIQNSLIEETLEAGKHQKRKIYAIATDPTHYHALVGWRDNRPWQEVRRALRSSLSRRLNKDFGTRTWFVEGASRKRVHDREHFDYLINEYLPKHVGFKWRPGKGVYK